jgi:hypothetical protein
MAFARLKGVSAAAAAALALGASLVAAPQASADSTPSTSELLSACSWADYCQFHPQSFWTYIGPAHQVGTTAFNCGSVTNSQTINWSDTTSSANSVGVSISASYKFAEVFEVSIETSYQHTWTEAHTDGQSDTVNVPAKYAGWMTRGTAKQEATGWYELHFGSRYYGHYIWYIENYAESGFDADNPNAGYVTFHDRPMTSYERQSQGC